MHVCMSIVGIARRWRSLCPGLLRVARVILARSVQEGAGRALSGVGVLSRASLRDQLGAGALTAEPDP